MIQALREGDLFAFEQVFISHRERVYAYFRKKTGLSEEAADLVQISFLKLWQYRSTLSDNHSLDQHLFYICRTVFIDWLRAQNKAGRVREAAQLHLRPEPPDYRSDLKDLKDQLGAALSGMPETRRRVFELNRLQGYSYRQVADLLSIPLKSVDNHLSKALRQLRKAVYLCVLILLYK